MRVKIFIVTYNNNEVLNDCLASIFENLPTESKYNVSVHIINNHSHFHIHDDFKKENNLFVIHNEGRPDFSTGHLARNWNQAIIHGMKSIKEPDCDVLILAQNDSRFVRNFIRNIEHHLETYDYLTFGVGDEVQIMTKSSIEKIGLFDERFCNIGYQECDYFMRAILLNRDMSSINDHRHGRPYNTVVNDVVCDKRCNDVQLAHHKLSNIYHNISNNVLIHKWGKNIAIADIFNEYIQSEFPVIPKQFITYPYFEAFLPSLDQKYIVY